jgi:hypothetical protein
MLLNNGHPVVLREKQRNNPVKSAIRVSTRLLCVTALVAFLHSVVVPKEAWAQETMPEENAVVRHLNTAITWYRHLMAANAAAGEPSDAFYLDNARSLARQSVQLAFQSAEAEAALLRAEEGDASASGSPNLSPNTSSAQRNYAKSAAARAAQIAQTQVQIDSLNSQITNASGDRRAALVSRRDSFQAELDFDKAREEALRKLSGFMSGNARKAGGLQKEIDDLKKLVPEIFAEAPGQPAPPGSSGSAFSSNPGSGLIDQASAVFSRVGDLREIDELIAGAGNVSADALQAQAPLRTRLRATIDQGNSLGAPTPSRNPANGQALREKAIFLTARFKQISAATIPLAQESILLDECQANLRRWEESAKQGYTQFLRSFLVHLTILLLGIAIVIGASALWRSATFRYVHEARMRHQLLLLRHITTGLLLAIVLVLGFVSEFSSLATFAGFVAAGVAVALQTLLLSVAGYFFLIGRHGVMVGDRVSVSGVTGDVIYVGLVRFFLTELAGSGSDLHPTGRVVIISNSVLFLGIPLLKQIPGTAYAWHEVVMKLERGSDYNLAENKVLEAVNCVYAEYRGTFEQQNQAVKGLITASTVVPRPQARLQLVEKGLHLVVRYPVVLLQETEIDNEVARKVMDAIHSDPDLKDAVGSPTIQPALKT